MIGEREKFAAEIAALDALHSAEAERIFEGAIGLEEAIYQHIVPAVQRLNVEGVRGTALVFAPGWIVSNSHVVGELESLQAGRFANQAILPDAERAFFRPKKLGNHPDIMMAKIGEYAGVGAMPNPLAQDALYESVRYFTIDYSYEDPIRWLTHHEDSLDGYSTFTFEDGDLPSQGLSGSPIMAAHLRKEAKTPTWSFSLHSLVFAYKADTNHMCSMPIAGDLSQLQQVMFAKAVQERAEDSIFGGHNSAFSWTAKQAESSYNYALHAYRQGEGASPIHLPPNLEPLFGNEVMPIACSLLLEQRLTVPQAGKGVKQPGSKNSARATKMQKRGQSEMGSVSFSELEADRNTVYADLKSRAVKRYEEENLEYIQVSEQPDTKDPCIIAESKYFRIDYLGCLNSGYYLFALQDNILDADGKPTKINGKAASSTFAMAKIYTESTYIDVDILLRVLQQSEKKAAYFYVNHYGSTLGSAVCQSFVQKLAKQYLEGANQQTGSLCLKAKNHALQNSKRFDKDNNSAFVDSLVTLRSAAP
jgi:hypothetical protein